MKESERRARARETKHLAELVEKVLDGYHVREDVRRHRIATEWPKIVGARIAEHARPGPLREGVLEVRVGSAPWLHQLSFLSDEIVERIHRATGDPQVVTSIRWTLASATAAERPTHVRRGRARTGAVMPARSASPERARTIDAESDSVEDEELRALIADVRKRYDL